MAGSKDVVLRHISAFNARDRQAEPWSADAEMVSPGGAMTGRDQVLAFLGAFQEAFPDGRLDVTSILADGSAAAVEGTFRGTHNGTLHAPGGDIGATGKSIEFRWAALYQTEGEQLASEHLFFDQLDFLSQLGIARAERRPQLLRSRLIGAIPEFSDARAFAGNRAADRLRPPRLCQARPWESVARPPAGPYTLAGMQNDRSGWVASQMTEGTKPPISAGRIGGLALRALDHGL